MTSEEAAGNTDSVPNATLFVKNLNFDSTEASLKAHFEAAGLEINSASIATKKDMKRQGMLLSMGYGFVNFKTASTASEALKTLQHKMLDGHSLELKRSNRAATSEVNTNRKVTLDVGKASAKIIARNIPFEATHREVEAIFSTFGQLKGVRLPKKVRQSELSELSHATSI